MGRREDIDREVRQWAISQNGKGLTVTPMDIRHKAFEVGQICSLSGFKASQNWYVNWKKRTGYECTQSKPVNGPKKTYTAAFKLQAVQKASQMESASQASLALNVSRRCLQRWKQDINIITAVAGEAGTAIYRRPGQGRKVYDSELDGNLLSWIQSLWAEELNVTPAMVRNKALELCKEPGFKASFGWYVKFARRCNLDLKEMSCESSPDKKETLIKLKILPHEQTHNGIVLAEGPEEGEKGAEGEGERQRAWTEHFDRVLLDWVVGRVQGGERVPQSLVRARAAQLCPDDAFDPSPSWLAAWVAKHRLYNIYAASSSSGVVEVKESGQQFAPISVYSHPNISVGRIPSSEETPPAEPPLDGMARPMQYNFLQYEPPRSVAMATQDGDPVGSLDDDDLLTLTTEVVEVATMEEVVTESPPQRASEVPEQREVYHLDDMVSEVTVTTPSSEPVPTPSDHPNPLYCEEDSVSR